MGAEPVPSQRIRLVWPVLDLAVRLIVAQRFFFAGVSKIANWPAALYLAEHQYRVTGMSAASAAYASAAIELVCPVLLAAGVLTRCAALPLLVLSLLVQVSYNPVDSQLYLAALLAWYAIQGAGPLSLGRALPPQGLQARLTAPYLALVRVWIALALLLAGLHVKSLFGQSILRVQILLPVSSVAHWPALLNLGCGVLLLAGLATRPVALAMIVGSAATAMTHSWQFDDVYFAATLAVLAMFGGGRASADQWLGSRGN
jgi:uncharacterized membrane protein YphA (DoxX/SURF4 family)